MQGFRYKKVHFGILRPNRSLDGPVARLKQAGIPVCPECLANWDLFSYRTSPAQDSCGHIKCNNCMNTNFGLNEMCFQCKPLSSTNRPTASADKPSEPQRPIVKIKEILTEEGQLKKIYIFPKEIRICLERIKTKYDSPLKDPSASKINQSSSSTNKIRSRIQIPSNAPFENSSTNPFDKNCSSVEINFKNDNNNNFKGQTTIVPKIVPIRIKIGARPSDTKVVKEKRNSGEERKAEKIANYITVLPSNGSRPFPCELCGTGFRRMGNLERHIRKNHSRSKKDSNELSSHIAEIEFQNPEIYENKIVLTDLLEQAECIQIKKEINESTEQYSPVPIKSYVNTDESATKPECLASPSFQHVLNFDFKPTEVSNEISPLNNHIIRIEETSDFEITAEMIIKEEKPVSFLENFIQEELIPGQMEEQVSKSTETQDIFHPCNDKNLDGTSTECSESISVMVKIPTLKTPGSDYIKLPFGILTTNPSPDGPIVIMTQAGIPVCPECGVNWDLSTYGASPSQDSCGHAKCNKCMMENFDLYGMCFQCKQMSNKNGPIARVSEPPKQKGPIRKTKEILIARGKPKNITKFPEEIRICLETIKTDVDVDFEKSSNFEIIQVSSTPSQIRDGIHLSNVTLENISPKAIEETAEINPINGDNKNLYTPYVPIKNKISAKPSDSIVVKTGRGFRRGRKPAKTPNYITVIASNDNAPPLYNCLKCGKIFKTKALIKIHEFCRKPKLKPYYVCQICDKNFIAKTHFDYHQSSHTAGTCRRMDNHMRDKKINYPPILRKQGSSKQTNREINAFEELSNPPQIDCYSEITIPLTKPEPIANSTFLHIIDSRSREDANPNEGSNEISHKNNYILRIEEPKDLEKIDDSKEQSSPAPIESHVENYEPATEPEPLASPTFKVVSDFGPREDAKQTQVSNEISSINNENMTIEETPDFEITAEMTIKEEKPFSYLTNLSQEEIIPGEIEEQVPNSTKTPKTFYKDSAAHVDNILTRSSKSSLIIEKCPALNVPGLEYKKLIFGILSTNLSPDGPTGILKRAGIPVCPECHANWDLDSYGSSPVQDSCGHVKCTKCMRKYFTLDEMCFQCKNISSNMEPINASFDKPAEQNRSSVKTKNILMKAGEPTKFAKFPPKKFKIQRRKNEKLSKQFQNRLKKFKRNFDAELEGPSASKIIQPSSSFTNKLSNGMQNLSNVIFEKNISSNVIDTTRSLEFNHNSDNVISQTATTEIISPKIKIPTKPPEPRIALDGMNRKKNRTAFILPDYITAVSSSDTAPCLYHCLKCGKKFKTKAHVKYHEFCQSNLKPYVCEICNKRFITKAHFEYHERTHTGERPYKCPKCFKSFNQKGKVTRHMRSHTGEKPFSCSQCGKSFSDKQALASHFLIHTGERPYACNFCNKRFIGLTNLKNHLFVHTGDRPFECSSCKKRFSLKWSLDLHMKTHSSDKPHVCNECNQTFSFVDNLRRHQLTHTGARPFRCNLCGTAFKRKDNLDRHIRITHSRSKQGSSALSQIALCKLNNAENMNTQIILPKEVASTQIYAESNAPTEQSSPGQIVSNVERANLTTEPQPLASPIFPVFVDRGSKKDANFNQVSYEILPIKTI